MLAYLLVDSQSGHHEVSSVVPIAVVAYLSGRVVGVRVGVLRGVVECSVQLYLPVVRQVPEQIQSSSGRLAFVHLAVVLVFEISVTLVVVSASRYSERLVSALYSEALLESVVAAVSSCKAAFYASVERAFVYRVYVDDSAY